MRKLIETTQENGIQCDAEGCMYSVRAEEEFSLELLKEYLNQPCPLCGANLLTEKDFKDSVSLFKYINWINKWFGWTTIFMSKNATYTEAEVHVHNGYNVKKIKD